VSGYYTEYTGTRLAFIELTHFLKLFVLISLGVALYMGGSPDILSFLLKSLGLLFLVSGMSTGAATIMWMSKDHRERKIMSMIDLVLIIVEMFFITNLFMGFMASTAVQIEAAELFLGGEFTVPLPDGDSLKIKVSSGTRAGTRFKQKHHGMGRLNRRGRGDLLVEIDIHVPGKIKRSEKELLKKLEESPSFQVKNM